MLISAPFELMPSLSKEAAAELLRISPEKLQSFEQSYHAFMDSETPDDCDLFSSNSRDAAQRLSPKNFDEEMVRRVADEVAFCCSVYSYTRENHESFWRFASVPDQDHLVSLEDIHTLPKELRPQFTSRYIQKDCAGESYLALLYFLQQIEMHKHDDRKQKFFYNHFRQGLDILDLDNVVYEILSMNKNSIGYWLPKIIPVIVEDGFFSIPSTSVLKVPLPMLQLTRLDFQSLTGTTLEIVNRVCEKVFSLDYDKEYFIKTGTYSAKFDFRNAYVHGSNEVHDIGTYFLYLQNVACQMASPLCSPSIYGVSTTNEWCVREFIPDLECNPCIYKGLPLHTEYRFFVDFTYGVILGETPYWDPATMKERFHGGGVIGNNAHDFHDYVVYQSHENLLMSRHDANLTKVTEAVRSFVSAMNKKCQENSPDALWDQWSIDIMQNGDTFWFIDMATAETSAFYQKCVPEEMRNPQEERWLPDFHALEKSTS